MKDKEYEKMLEEIVPAMNTVIFTKPNIERAISPQEIKSSVKNAIITDNTRDALERAKTMAPQGRLDSRNRFFLYHRGGKDNYQ